MTIATNTLVQRVRLELEDEPWEDVLTAAVAAAGTLTMTVNQPTQWAEGDRVEFDDATGEIARVKATPSANPVSIARGRKGTTAVAHSDGAVILKNPEFEYDEILAAIKRVIDGLWSYAYKVDTSTLTFTANKHIYEVPATFLGVIDLVQDATVTAGLPKLRRYGEAHVGSTISVLEHLPTTVSSTGMGVYIPTTYITPVATALLTYARIISSTPSGGNLADVDDGLLADAIVLGATARLLQNSEVHRGFDDVQQGDIGVGVGGRLRTAAWYQQQYEQRRREYELYLKRTAPVALPWRR